jgi:hypothetical protein
MIALDNATSFTPEMLGVMDPLRTLLLRENYIDSLADSAVTRKALEPMGAYLEAEGIIAIHYTRAEPEHITAAGLLCTTGVARRAWFLENYGYNFTAREIEAIKNDWNDYFHGNSARSRDNKIWFALTTNELRNGGAGARDLLEHFGGETIFMPLKNRGVTDPFMLGITAKIRRLGVPLIVRCATKPSRLQSFGEHFAALVWLSTFHQSINPAARPYDVDAYVTEAITTREIVSIDRVDFAKEHSV